jgi:hypothetical protein
MMSHSVVIAGALVQKRKITGHTWVLLQYLLGFKRLGCKTLFLDYLDPSICVDAVGRSCAFEGSINLRYVLDVVRFFGLEDDYVLIGPGGESLIGMPRSRLLERVRDAAFLLNIETLAPPPGLSASLCDGGSSSFARAKGLGPRETCPARSGR